MTQKEIDIQKLDNKIWEVILEEQKDKKKSKVVPKFLISVTEYN